MRLRHHASPPLMAASIDLTTPALLFPAISLLLLAYTNRFLTIAALVRSLHQQYKTKPDQLLEHQIGNLRTRAYLIQRMQAFGVTSLLLCVLCMFLIFAGERVIAQYAFGLSLILLMISLGLSVREIQISVDALELQLSDLEQTGDDVMANDHRARE
jgi:hypothetical protein